MLDIMTRGVWVPPTLPVLLTLLAALASCEPEAISSDRSAEFGFAIDTTPLLTLNRWDTTEEAQVMVAPLGAAFVGDSVVVVLDGESRELRAFDLEGHVQWRAGGRGGGEGEFASAPWTLFVGGAGELTAFDVPALRGNRYDHLGRSVVGVGMPASGDRNPEVFGVLEGDPPLAVVGYESPPAGGLGRATLWLSTVGLHAPPSVDTIGAFPGPLLTEISLEEGVAIGVVPGSQSLLAAVRGQDIVTAAVDDSLRVLDRAGAVRRVFPLPPDTDVAWRGGDLSSIALDGSRRAWLGRRMVQGERYRRWVVMDLATGRYTPELRLGGNIRGIGRTLIALAVSGEMGETLIQVHRLKDLGIGGGQ